MLKYATAAGTAETDRSKRGISISGYIHKTKKDAPHAAQPAVALRLMVQNGSERRDAFAGPQRRSLPLAPLNTPDYIISSPASLAGYQ